MKKLDLQEQYSAIELHPDISSDTNLDAGCKDIKRRSVFATIGKGAIGSALLTILPLRLFAGRSSIADSKSSNIEVRINTNAIKRNNK